MRLLFSALAVALVTGCGVDHSGLGTGDGGSPDAPTDMPPLVDFGSDLGIDGGPVDLGPDTGPLDLGTDTGPLDLGTDLGPPDLGPPDLGPPDLGPPDMCPPSGDVTCVAGTTCSCDCGRSCMFHCPAGGCTFACNGASTCTFDCDMGGCRMTATAFSSVTGTCNGDGCTEVCAGGSITMMCSSVSLSCTGSRTHVCM